MKVKIRLVESRDSSAWERMRQKLWPSGPGEHAGEIAGFFGGHRDDPAEVLLACTESGEAIGFIELSIRSYAEGCSTGHVAYIEGWFVERDVRGQGVGTALVKAAEEWGRAQRCEEIASDTEIENVTSIRAHTSLGFSKVGRGVCFRKPL